MFRANAIPALRSARAQVQQTRSFVSKAQFVGRLGAAPERHSTQAGTSYFKYAIATNKPPKKDADGKLITDANGYPVRETNWYTIFNFNDRQAEYLEKLVPGSLLFVEATIDVLTTPAAVEGEAGSKQYVFRESSHRVLSKPPTSRE
ncbi:hypothetical protein IAT38_005171 [Cryptococcus sp. DSM 104549]